MEIRFIFRKLGNTRPRTFGRGPHEAENLLQLIFVGGAGEQWATGVHFCHDATGGPNVDAGVISSATKQDIRSTIPQGYNFVGESVDRNTKSSGKTKISEFELTFIVDEEILRFQVPVKNAVFVAKGDPLEQLMHERADCEIVELAAATSRIHIFFEVFVHVFKHEHKLVFRVDHIMKGDDILMLELFHQRDLTNRGGWCAFFGIEMDFLERHQFAGLTISPFENLIKKTPPPD